MKQELPPIPASWSKEDLRNLIQEFHEHLQEKKYELPLQTEGVVILSGAPEIKKEGTNEKSPENSSRINYGIDFIKQIVSEKSGKLIEEVSNDDILQFGPVLILNGESEQLMSMKEIALDAGFPQEKIELVDCGERGKANTKTQFETINSDPCYQNKSHFTFVTTSYHAPRVSRTANKQLSNDIGFDIIGVPYQDFNFNVFRKTLGEVHRIISYSEKDDISKYPRKG